MAVLKTESVTNWWPQTSSSKAFVVCKDPGCRTSAHRTANGVGAQGDSHPVAQQACVCLVELESVEAHSYRIRTGRSSGIVGAFSHFDTNRSLVRHATTVGSNPRRVAAACLVLRRAGA